MSQAEKMLKCLAALINTLIALGAEITAGIAAFSATIKDAGIGIVMCGYQDGYPAEAKALADKLIAALEKAKTVAEKATYGIREARHEAEAAIAASPTL